nr:MAG TPA: Protein of unknown function (DUF1642) [Caudoviricetes sp.]
MNKQELIKKYKRLEGVWDAAGAETARQIFLQDLDQLDEPEKVKIPQFVADWIEKCKNKEKSLLDALLYTPEKVNSWVGNSENQETFAIAWIFGYEVEKEKRYTVVMKETKQPLYYNAGDKKLFFSMAKIASHFTRQQLEKLNFSWVFDCEGIEIEEVED